MAAAEATLYGVPKEIRKALGEGGGGGMRGERGAG